MFIRNDYVKPNMAQLCPGRTPLSGDMHGRGGTAVQGSTALSWLPCALVSPSFAALQPVLSAALSLPRHLQPLWLRIRKMLTLINY